MGEALWVTPAGEALGSKPKGARGDPNLARPSLGKKATMLAAAPAMQGLG